MIAAMKKLRFKEAPRLHDSFHSFIDLPKCTQLQFTLRSEHSNRTEHDITPTAPSTGITPTASTTDIVRIWVSEKEVKSVQGSHPTGDLLDDLNKKCVGVVITENPDKADYRLEAGRACAARLMESLEATISRCLIRTEMQFTPGKHVDWGMPLRICAAQ